ncbi:hypothetical protein HYH03_003341 [Edaphochlamys debaryana]|uniref:Uncharacterized protein n=1 Tax=Edaphochlamys debaryana TaxID=47281 RepID=A0A835YH55_9CHLO|nr:hypothetical protein HYH03_003341 [Edaphochlamys debaryana]|eukprot:KAG2498590.1 hypothetical protein HYH03_003341 [Edaphochlamys debaryana]
MRTSAPGRGPRLRRPSHGATAAGSPPGRARVLALGACLALAGLMGAAAQGSPFLNRLRILSGATRDTAAAEERYEPKEPLSDWFPPAASPVPRGKCVCALDFDGVLRGPPPGATDLDTPAADASRVVQACKDAGMHIAICSANDNYDKMSTVLSQRVDPSTFTPAFFQSGAFQMSTDDKSVTLNNIIRYFNTPPSCVMLFDDMDFNKPYAQQTGAIFIQTPPHTGITMNDFWRAQAALPNYCQCG